LLYELSSGRDRLEFPSLPAEIAGLPDTEAYLELNEVVTRACAPVAAERYQTATAFEADLNLFFAGRSLRRARSSERNITQLKRLAAVACVLFVLTAMALAVSKRAENEAQERADRELNLRRRVENAEQEARQQLYTALLEQARANVRSGEVGHRVQTLQAVRRAAGISNSVEPGVKSWLRSRCQI
jgi:preprotein translocase subunit SecG